MKQGSDSMAIAYIGIEQNNNIIWGAGMDEDIIKASMYALLTAINNMLTHAEFRVGKASN